MRKCVEAHGHKNVYYTHIYAHTHTRVYMIQRKFQIYSVQRLHKWINFHVDSNTFCMPIYVCMYVRVFVVLFCLIMSCKVSLQIHMYKCVLCVYAKVVLNTNMFSTSQQPNSTSSINNPFVSEILYQQTMDLWTHTPHHLIFVPQTISNNPLSNYTKPPPSHTHYPLCMMCFPLFLQDVMLYQVFGQISKKSWM